MSARHPAFDLAPLLHSSWVAGRLELGAVREGAHVVDFIWLSITGAASRLLRCEPSVLHGRRLRDSQAAGPLGQPGLVERYRRVVDQGDPQTFEQVHLVDRQQDIVLHRVLPLGDGVCIHLVNLSAQRRAIAQRLRIDGRTGSADRAAGRHFVHVAIDSAARSLQCTSTPASTCP